MSSLKSVFALRQTALKLENAKPILKESNVLVYNLIWYISVMIEMSTARLL